MRTALLFAAVVLYHSKRTLTCPSGCAIFRFTAQPFNSGIARRFSQQRYLLSSSTIYQEFNNWGQVKQQIWRLQKSKKTQYERQSFSIIQWAAKLKEALNRSYNIPLWHAKSPISLASAVPKLHWTKYLQATPSTNLCRFRFTEQLGAKGHSALETLVYLAVHLYYTVLGYLCITPSRFPVVVLCI